jgi:hypothetical protein
MIKKIKHQIKKIKKEPTYIYYHKLHIKKVVVEHPLDKQAKIMT